MRRRLKKVMDKALEVDPSALRRALPASSEELAKNLKTTRGRVIDALDDLAQSGVMVEEFGGVWSTAKFPHGQEDDP